MNQWRSPPEWAGPSGYISGHFAIESSDLFSYSDDCKIFSLRDSKPSPLNKPCSGSRPLSARLSSPLPSCLQRLPSASFRVPCRYPVQRISALGVKWAHAGWAPACLTLSSYRGFSRPLCSPGPAFLCGFKWSGLLRWERMRQHGWQHFTGGFRCGGAVGLVSRTCPLWSTQPSAASSWPNWYASCLML